MKRKQKRSKPEHQDFDKSGKLSNRTPCITGKCCDDSLNVRKSVERVHNCAERDCLGGCGFCLRFLSCFQSHRDVSMGTRLPDPLLFLPLLHTLECHLVQTHYFHDFQQLFHPISFHHDLLWNRLVVCHN